MGDLGVPSLKEIPIFGRKKRPFKTLKLHGPKWLSESTKCSQSTRDEPNESKCWMELLLKAVEKMQDLHDENVAKLGQLFFDVRIPSSFRYTDKPSKN